MKKVIVTDIKYRMAMSPIRELSKKGYNVTAVEYDNVLENKRLGHFSKYVSQKTTVTDTNEEFIEGIKNLSKDDRAVLIPVNRKSLMYAIRNSDELKNYCDFLVPDIESINLADDKFEICEIAKKVGVPVPKTTSISEHDSVEEMEKSVDYPCIIKYRNGEAMGKKPEDRYKIVYNKEEFISLYNEMLKQDANPIASDYIKGHDIGVAVIMDKNSKPVDFLCYESLREFPIEGGPTCFLRTIFDRNLLKYACSLLEEIKFTGIAMLDFKGTIEKPYFLEINPRVWGSAMITEISGSSLFESYVKASLGNSTPLDLDNCMPNYKLNQKMRFTPQSFACFISHMKKSKGKGKIFIEYLKSFFDFSVRDGLFSLRDSKPYFMYIKNLLKK